MFVFSSNNRTSMEDLFDWRQAGHRLDLARKPSQPSMTSGRAAIRGFCPKT